MSEPFHHIVVAYDGSAQARMALDRAIDMARTWASRLTIVMVYQPPILWPAGPMMGAMMGPMPSPEPPSEDVKKTLNEVLRLAVQTAEERGVSNVRGELLQDHPAEAILSVVDHEHADLVVMGSRGQSTTTRLLLGSVSDAVIHHARVAVLVVRPPA
jgi:nucleotide-binding universal stress UspA family protein